MKALTIWPEWALAFALGKDCENRSWCAPWVLRRGPIALHAGQRIGGGAIFEGLAAVQAELQTVAGVRLRLDEIKARLPEPGTIFGMAVVSRFVREDDRAIKTKGGPWFHGPFGWKLRNVTLLPRPVPAVGRQGLWEVPGDVYAEVIAQRSGFWRPGAHGVRGWLQATG